MFYFFLVVQAVLCVMLIGLVLLQQGKGADMGAAFGGGSNTIFGASGAGTLITRLTTGICIAFFASSVFLVRAYQSHGFVPSSSGDVLSGSVMQKVQAPAAAESAEKVDSNPAPQGASGSAKAPEAAPKAAVAPVENPAPVAQPHAALPDAGQANPPPQAKK